MGYRRNRPRWRRGGRDTFPLAMAGLVGCMLLALVATLVWAAFGGPGPGPVAKASEDSAPAADRAGQTERGDPTPAASPTAELANVEDSPGGGSPARTAPAPSGPADADDEDREAPRPRTVVTPVATRPSPPPRPLPPSDTTAAGHAGLAEALLAAGDTTGAIAAYNAFLARNTDPARERAAIAKLRALSGSR